MRITGFKAQVKNPDRVSVFIDGRFFCGLGLNQVVELGIKQGQDLSEAEAKALRRQSDLGKIESRALEWLLRRPHSRREFSDYLRRKRLDPDEHRAITAKLDKYIDEDIFARTWIDNRRRKGYSSKHITAELMSKGLSVSQIKSALEESETDDAQSLTTLISKKRKLSRYQDSQKLIRYLVSKGYDYQAIRQQLEL